VSNRQRGRTASSPQCMRAHRVRTDLSIPSKRFPIQLYPHARIYWPMNGSDWRLRLHAAGTYRSPPDRSLREQRILWILIAVGAIGVVAFVVLQFVALQGLNPGGPAMPAPGP
jgi:hypothetical protein